MEGRNAAQLLAQYGVHPGFEGQPPSPRSIMETLRRQSTLRIPDQLSGGLGRGLDSLSAINTTADYEDRILGLARDVPRSNVADAAILKDMLKAKSSGLGGYSKAGGTRDLPSQFDVLEPASMGSRGPEQLAKAKRKTSFLDLPPRVGATDTTIRTLVRDDLKDAGRLSGSSEAVDTDPFLGRDPLFADLPEKDPKRRARRKELENRLVFEESIGPALDQYESNLEGMPPTVKKEHVQRYERQLRDAFDQENPATGKDPSSWQIKKSQSAPLFGESKLQRGKGIDATLTRGPLGKVAALPGEDLPMGMRQSKQLLNEFVGQTERQLELLQSSKPNVLASLPNGLGGARNAEAIQSLNALKQRQENTIEVLLNAKKYMRRGSISPRFLLDKKMLEVVGLMAGHLLPPGLRAILKKSKNNII